VRLSGLFVLFWELGSFGGIWGFVDPTHRVKQRRDGWGTRLVWVEVHDVGADLLLDFATFDEIDRDKPLGWLCGIVVDWDFGVGVEFGGWVGGRSA